VIEPSRRRAPENTLGHLGTATLFTLLSVVVFGVLYPVGLTLLSELVLGHQANGSLVVAGGTVVGSELVGQSFTRPSDFHGRPSAAGKDGYDPTATGGTNLGPTSKKLIDATRATIATLRKANPDAEGPIPMDLVTSSASGIDPDISPEGAYYQAPRVAKARGMSLGRVRALIDAHVHPRQLGFLGEPHVNVLELNLALDARR
jgi:K+-transporting ATPase ATPase C chain